jgi:hypothetical protein
MQMRSDMLDYPATMSSATRIGVISQDSDVGIATKLHLTIRIYNRFGTPSASRHKLSIHLSINRYGKTSVKPKKRVNVKPDRWCGWCGAFDGAAGRQVATGNGGKVTLTAHRGQWIGGPTVRMGDRCRTTCLQMSALKTSRKPKVTWRQDTRSACTPLLLVWES